MRQPWFVADTHTSASYFLLDKSLTPSPSIRGRLLYLRRTSLLPSTVMPLFPGRVCNVVTLSGAVVLADFPRVFSECADLISRFTVVTVFFCVHQPIVCLDHLVTYCLSIVSPLTLCIEFHFTVTLFSLSRPLVLLWCQQSQISDR